MKADAVNNGPPVSEGVIVFEDPATGSAERIELKSNGGCEVERIGGTYSVSVEPLLVETKSKVEGPPDYLYKKVDNILEKYGVGVSSGLKHTVSGPGKLNVDIKK